MPPSAQRTVFGLDVRADRPLAFLEGASALPTGRRLELSLAATVAELEWPSDAALISDERGAGGEVVFQIERSALGFRIGGPLYGAAIVSADGSSVRGSPGTGGLGAWQRLLVAQVLPFAAVLCGLEVLHASAVALGGGAVAILGPSGAGKTSLAVALSRLGADFLTDDVLALSCEDGRLLGHPGPAIAAIDSAEAERLRHGGGLDPEGLLGEDRREAVVRMAPSSSPLPLRAIFVLDRRAAGPAQPHFEPVLEPTALLSATFNLLLLEPARLTALLEVCAIAARGRVERVAVGPGGDATALAGELAARLEADP